MSKRLAKLITNIVNPFLVSAVLLVLLAFKDTAKTGEAIKWASISLALSVIPVFILVVFMVRRKKLEGLFDNPRQQRNVIYIMASVLAALGCALLWWLKAPHLLSVTFTAGLICMVIFMSLNYYWKVSVHTAFTAAAVVMLIMVYGAIAAWTVVLVPTVAWARIKLQQHSLSQVVIGSLLAAAVVAGVFWGFGVVG
jgi:membrane-associated phospholipid phosphatase